MKIYWFESSKTKGSEKRKCRTFDSGDKIQVEEELIFLIVNLQKKEDNLEMKIIK